MTSTSIRLEQLLRQLFVDRQNATKNDINNKQCPIAWRESGCQMALHAEILNSITNILKSEKSIDTERILSYPLNVDRYNITTLYENDIAYLKQVDYYPDAIKSQLNDICDIVLCNKHTNYAYNRIILCKLLGPIYIQWNSNCNDSFKYISDFNSISDFKFNPMLHFNDFYKGVVNNKDQINKLIEFCLPLYTNYMNIIKFSKSIKTDTLTTQQVSVSKANNKSDPIKTSHTTQSVKPIITLSSLSNLKIIGLKQLCTQLQLNTNKCHKRDDYIKLLTPHCKKD